MGRLGAKEFLDVALESVEGGRGVDLVFELLGVFLHAVEPLDALVLGPGDAQLLVFVAALHAPLHVHVVVLNDAQDDVTRRDAFRALRSLEFPCFLNGCVDVLGACAAVWRVVMRHIVDVVLLEEVQSDDPWARADDLIDPLAVPENGATLLLSHHNLALLLDGLLVATHSHDQVHVGEEFLGLFEHSGVADVVHVKHTVRVHSNWPVRGCLLTGFLGNSNLLGNVLLLL